jgi:hypothetical protein
VPEEISFVHHNDESLLDLFLDRLNFGGKILFFTKSIGWEQASFVVQAFEKQGKIEMVEEYKSLLVYSKLPRSCGRLPTSCHYVDNNSTPTMVSNLLEAKHSLF